MLEAVRSALLHEARLSPALLSDLAGLEQYIAETYDSRSFVELLQNADDAGATRFTIKRAGGYLIVANDGRQFTREDFESLCRSAASTKTRGNTIGYRGIGFKSVVGIASTVHIISGDLAATFSREKTSEDVPGAERVPLVRIPHPLGKDELSKVSDVLDPLMRSGMTTAFVFNDLVANSIENEFSAFDPSSLLFVRNVTKLDLDGSGSMVYAVTRHLIDERTREIDIENIEAFSEWSVIDQQGVAIAFRRDGNSIVRLIESEAVVHAFLPTHDQTGLGVKIHADFSTDPSRTRIVLDDRTNGHLKRVADLVLELLNEVLSGQGRQEWAGMIAALVPTTDPRLAGLQRRSFNTELVAALKRRGEGFFEDLRCKPSWLNEIDFEALSKALGVRAVPRNLEQIKGLPELALFMGAKEATLKELGPGIRDLPVTVLGAAEIVAHVSHQYATKQADASQLDAGWRVWPIKGKLMSLPEAKELNTPLDQEFVDLLAERSSMGLEPKRLISAICDEGTSLSLLPEAPSAMLESHAEEGKVLTDSKRNGFYMQRSPAKRWRAAEEQVLSIFAAQGWSVEDVSRQNVGYDIEGSTPQGERMFIEVKSITSPGEPFTLTSNEEAVAREKARSYLLAIVRQTEKCLEITFIRDPAQKLHMTRQCKKWVWECAVYDYEPKQFPFE
ncbi:MAG: DUF3883 domain-containing protein [Pseudohongiellaceae bacterium]